MGKKNLEQLFKDTFKGFQEVPDEKVWNAIEASLDKNKKKKRVVPLWWQLGGAAAILAVILYVINPFESKPQNDETIITDVKIDTESTSREEMKSKIMEHNASSSVIASEESMETSSGANTESNQEKNISRAPKLKRSTNQHQLADADSGEKKRNTTIVKNKASESQGSNEAIALAQPNRDAMEDEIALNQGQKKRDNAISKSDHGLAQDDVQKEQKEKQAVQNIVEAQKEDAMATTDENDAGKSIYDAIKEQKEKESAVVGTSGKWSVGPSVAPVYFSAAGSGSPIHSDFASNSKSGNLNLSYGLSVAYEVGKKLKIRSGVHRVNYGYDTNDVLFSSSAGTSAADKYANINYSQKSETLVVQSKNSSSSNALTDAFLELSSNETPILDGKMVQQLGYIEVPVELNYALIDKKFGVDLIGGMSSLFLIENSVLVESGGMVAEVGEATNANDVNFSANFGMGLNYDFSTKVELSVEPVFKYQMNTFSKTAGDFQPFSIGIYSGVRFKF